MNPRFFKDDINLADINLSSIEEESLFCRQLGERFSLFKSIPEKAPTWLLKKELGDHVVFYPGTFNPWHLGHRACLELCPVKSIVVVPDFNPWKTDQERVGPWQKLKDLCETLDQTDYSIYPGFLSLEKGNPTVDWFPKLTCKKKSLLIGDDSFLNLHKWKDVDELVKHITTLFVVPRGESEVELEAQVLRFPELHIVFLGNHEFEEISSSELRGK